VYSKPLRNTNLGSEKYRCRLKGHPSDERTAVGGKLETI
jgi:hypothetical protein